jgi:hypothetical protein
MVPETSVIFNQLTRRKAQEDLSKWNEVIRIECSVQFHPISGDFWWRSHNKPTMDRRDTATRLIHMPVGRWSFLTAEYCYLITAIKDEVIAIPAAASNC